MKDMERSSARFTISTHTAFSASAQLEHNFVHSFRSVRIYLFRLSFSWLFRDMCTLTSRKSWTMRYCVASLLLLTNDIYDIGSGVSLRIRRGTFHIARRR